MSASTRLSILITLTAAASANNGAAQINRPGNTVPVLQYEAPANFMRLSASTAEDYSSTQSNGSVQVYQFEPFNGNVAEIFQRTLLRDRIDPMHREENVAGMPQFGRGEIPGAQFVMHANFAENVVGIARPHTRIIIVAGGAVAIVDASAINPASWARLAPELNNMVHTMRVVTKAAPPEFSEAVGPGGAAIAGIYQGMKSKFMTGLTFQPGYYVNALHFYVFSASGLVYRAYDEVRAPGGDVNRFDFNLAQRTNPRNTGHYAIRDDKLFIRMGSDPMIITAAPRGNAITIDTVNYVRQ